MVNPAIVPCPVRLSLTLTGRARVESTIQAVKSSRRQSLQDVASKLLRYQPSLGGGALSFVVTGAGDTEPRTVVLENVTDIRGAAAVRYCLGVGIPNRCTVSSRADSRLRLPSFNQGTLFVTEGPISSLASN